MQRHINASRANKHFLEREGNTAHERLLLSKGEAFRVAPCEPHLIQGELRREA